MLPRVDGPCPNQLDAHATDFLGPEGNFCRDASEYRYVGDFAATCADWQAASGPLDLPTTTTCSAALLYNEFAFDTDCKSCLQSQRSASYAACYPNDANGGYLEKPCDDLIRCMQACAPGDSAAADACEQGYAQYVDSANEFVACDATQCAGECD